MSRIQRTLLATAALFLLAPLAAQLGAQRLTTAVPSRDSTPVAAAAPTFESHRAAVDLEPLSMIAAGATSNLTIAGVTRHDVLTAPPERTSRNVALMIVGGAGMIVGAVVGGRSGNVIMIGGGVVGLIGLWNYLK